MGRLALLHMVAGGLLLFLVVAGIAIKQSRRLLRILRNPGHPGIDGFRRGLFQREPGAFKKCPDCEAALPLAALLCRVCNYNFLAARPAREQKRLLPPRPMSEEAPERRLAAGL